MLDEGEGEVDTTINDGVGSGGVIAGVALFWGSDGGGMGEISRSKGASLDGDSDALSVGEGAEEGGEALSVEGRVALGGGHGFRGKVSGQDFVQAHFGGGVGSVVRDRDGQGQGGASGGGVG